MTYECPTFDHPVDYATASLEDRCAPRLKIRIPASLRQSGSPGFSVMIQDLSISGFAAEALTGMKPGTRVWISIPGLCPQQAEVEWNDGFTIGCSFHNLLNTAVLDAILNHHKAIEDR
jgi:hypothetical protein